MAKLSAPEALEMEESEEETGKIEIQLQGSYHKWISFCLTLTHFVGVSPS